MHQEKKRKGKDMQSRFANL